MIRTEILDEKDIPSNPIKIIIPMYNEEKTITGLIDRINKTFNDWNRDVKIICVDDGSSDSTRFLLSGLDVTLICHKKNLGKGEALKNGFKVCELQDTIVTIDADGEHRPEEIPKLLSALLNRQADMIIGSRFMYIKDNQISYLNSKKHLAYVRKFGNEAFSLFAKMVTQKTITDTQSGFRAFRPNTIQNMNLEAKGFEIETEMILEALRRGYRIKEVPIYNDEVQRDSYMNIIFDSLKIGLTFLSGAVPKKLRFIVNFLIDKLNKIK